MSNEDKQAQPSINDAPRWIMVVCGSIIALTMCAKVIGIDLEPIFDAKAAQMIAEISSECGPSMLDDTLERITQLELIAHPPTTK